MFIVEKEENPNETLKRNTEKDNVRNKASILFDPGLRWTKGGNMTIPQSEVVD